MIKWENWLPFDQNTASGIAADEFSVKATANGKKSVFSISCDMVSGNNVKGTLTILKGDKVMLPGYDKKAAALKSN